MTKALSLVGNRYGSLVVSARAENTAKQRTRWECGCDCGNRTVVSGEHLRRGTTLSCGCLLVKSREEFGRRSKTHGMYRSKEWNAWQSLKRRCLSPKYANYDKYGGAGITVCQRWRDSFDAFYADMGPAPSLAHSIDRIDGSKDYEPANCRWADAQQQANNRRTNRKVAFQGRELTMSEWSRLVGISKTAIRRRLDAGWSVEKALTTPAREC